MKLYLLYVELHSTIAHSQYIITIEQVYHGMIPFY